MQNDFPLTLHHTLRRMRDVHPYAEVVTLTESGTERVSFGDTAMRVQALGRVLERLGVQPGERVGTFAWNNQRHFELYFAIPCAGAVLHTINVRLYGEQIEYIINHAQNRVIFIDASTIPLIAPVLPALTGVEHWVVMGDGDTSPLPNPLRYEDLLAEAGEGPHEWPEVDERAAAALCYTSGTTGNPKGVLYSHRSVCLHSTITLAADVFGLSARERVLAVVPMFHANAWGLAHASGLAGASIILPDKHLQAAPLAKLIEAERPTLMGCVPTIFADLLRYADEHKPDFSSLNNCACGGSAVPRALMEAFQERHGVRIWQAWGMTETSPLATFARPPESAVGEEHWRLRAQQGIPVPWVELRLVDDEGEVVPADGTSTGEVEVRGPWIAKAYYKDDSGDEKFDRGWLRTGDIGAVDETGSLRLTDRAKDVIKSGGEWISSVDLENELMAHPQIKEAAVIAKPDERWAERPLACVVLEEGAELSAEDLVEFLRPRVARFWLPDEFAIIAEVPKTSVGKFDKKVLRSRLADGTLEGRMKVGEKAAAS
jgi:fatty-acyl-CoA synthase